MIQPNNYNRENNLNFGDGFNLKKYVRNLSNGRPLLSVYVGQKDLETLVYNTLAIICGVCFGLSPLPVIVEMKVYRDSLLKM